MHRADPPRMGDQDLALVYERERRQPLPPCARPEKYFCDGCFAKDIQPRDMARVSIACPLCSYSLCAACGEGVVDHVCDGRCVHFGVKVELITFMQRFMTACLNCPDLIRTDDRLAANVALHARLADQRRWIRTVDRDRMVVRAKLRDGGRAHAEFLAETYARNPFASGNERW